jgi:hypothetical protein
MILESSKKDKNPRIRYSPPAGPILPPLLDGANTLAVVVGLGAAQALGSAAPWLRAVGVALGLLALGVGLSQWPQARRHVRDVARRLARRPATPAHVRRKAPPGHASRDTWYILPPAAALVGLCTALSGGLALALAAPALRWGGLAAGPIGWPAFAAWIAAEGVNAYEKLILKPKTGPSNASLAKSLLQMLGALAIWVYVILILTPKFDAALIAWLFVTGEILALLGLVLGMAAGLRAPRRD